MSLLLFLRTFLNWFLVSKLVWLFFIADVSFQSNIVQNLKINYIFITINLFNELTISWLIHSWLFLSCFISCSCSRLPRLWIRFWQEIVSTCWYIRCTHWMVDLVNTNSRLIKFYQWRLSIFMERLTN